MLAIGLDGIGDTPQHCGAFADTQPGPGALVEGPPRGTDGRFGIRRAGHRHLGQRLLVGRVDHWPQPGFGGLAPVAVDEQLMGRHGASPVSGSSAATLDQPGHGELMECGESLAHCVG
ncbi:hypothetical protein FQZ97_1086260 [compost metagenome]